MNKQDIFPVQAMAEDSGSSIKMEGQKVVFDKKVALLPVDIKMEEVSNGRTGNGRSNKQPGA